MTATCEVGDAGRSDPRTTFAPFVCAEGGANGHGAGVVRSLRQFDREQQKEHHVPIVMRDSGVPPRTGTSTLTIVIGDLNDNQHHAAHKHITVYSYNGRLRSRTP